MSRRIITVLIFVAVLPFAFAFKNAPGKKKGVQTIIIDPGHGGKDQGAKGAFTTEARICLSVGLKLGKAIEEKFPGVKVLYTRTTDVLPGNKPDKNQALRYRAEFANQSGGDLFIAVHVNAAPKIKHKVESGYKWVGKGKKRRKVKTYKYYYTPNPSHGTETFIWAADRTDDKSGTITPDDEFGETDTTIVIPEINDPVMKAFQLLYTKKYFENSLHFANLIEAEFVKGGRFSRGVKQRNEKGIWVLQATGMPSVLVETGFITDKDEEEYLDSDKGQNEIVDNLTSALANYIASKEKAPASNGGKSPDTKVIQSDAANLTRKNVSKVAGTKR
ncbi:MAG TPA: N-acetylmuramoyl-L-alanine amidase [Chitinophagaceae bacterium]|jgi:N-acetylmuramoyl-L-alanine amidase|nr:N-acetylmuramoyl-L-alanine amidase [Chitinophagaceae bacterium]